MFIDNEEEQHRARKRVRRWLRASPSEEELQTVFSSDRRISLDEAEYIGGIPTYSVWSAIDYIVLSVRLPNNREDFVRWIDLRLKWSPGVRVVQDVEWWLGNHPGDLPLLRDDLIRWGTKSCEEKRYRAGTAVLWLLWRDGDAAVETGALQFWLPDAAAKGDHGAAPLLHQLLVRWRSPKRQLLSENHVAELAEILLHAHGGLVHLDAFQQELLLRVIYENVHARSYEQVRTAYIEAVRNKIAEYMQCAEAVLAAVPAPTPKKRADPT